MKRLTTRLVALLMLAFFLITGAYDYLRLARERDRLGVRQVYWFNWASEYDPNSPAADVAFRFSGLTKLANDTFTPQPILRTYAGVAARNEGCRKGAIATACE